MTVEGAEGSFATNTADAAATAQQQRNFQQCHVLPIESSSDLIVKPSTTSATQQQAGSQTLYMPIASPPTPAPSPGPNISVMMGKSNSSNSINPITPEQLSVNTPVSPLTLPQNPVLRRQYLTALLKACTPAELLFISTTIAPLLKRDFLRALPPELALHILGFVDEPRTLARAAQVSRWWRRLVSDESIWKGLCSEFGFEDGTPKTGNTTTSKKGKGKERVVTEDDQPLVEMERYANLPMDPALEWIMAKKRRGRPTKAVNPNPNFSYRDHFKYSYTIMKNWHNGGHLLRAHRVPSTSITAQDSGVVTSLALDEDWVVVGLANCRIHVFSARTGVLARTLVGHDSGVWAVCLIRKGGKWGESGAGDRATFVGKRRRKKGASVADSEDRVQTGTSKRPAALYTRYSEGDLEASSSIMGADGWGGVGGHAGYAAGSNAQGAVGTGSDPPLDPFVPHSLRTALGLTANGKEFADTDDEEDDEGIVESSDEDAFDEASSEGSWNSDGRRNPGKPSDVCGSSEGWGQPNAIVVSGGCDKVVRVWDIKSGYCIYILRGHTSTIRCIKVLHNRPIAVSGSRDMTLRVWDVQRGRLLRTLTGHTSSVRCLDVCGNRVVSGSYDNTCRLWDVDTGECLHVLTGHMHQIYSVAFDGVRIASGGLDTTVRVWDAESGECIALLQGHTALVCQLQLSPTMLATGGSDGRVITFSLSTYAVQHRIAAHDSSVTSLQFDQRFLVTGGNDGRVRLFETQTGNYVRELSDPSESIWKVAYGPGAEVCAVMCRRAGKTVMEIWSLKPREDREREKEQEKAEDLKLSKGEGSSHHGRRSQTRSVSEGIGSQ